MLSVLNAFLNMRLVILPAFYLSTSWKACSKVLGLEDKISLRLFILIKLMVRIWCIGFTSFISIGSWIHCCGRLCLLLCWSLGTASCPSDIIGRRGCWDRRARGGRGVVWTGSCRWSLFLLQSFSRYVWSRWAGTFLWRTLLGLFWTSSSRLWCCVDSVRYIWMLILVMKI